MELLANISSLHNSQPTFRVIISTLSIDSWQRKPVSKHLFGRTMRIRLILSGLLSAERGDASHPECRSFRERSGIASTLDDRERKTVVKRKRMQPPSRAWRASVVTSSLRILGRDARVTSAVYAGGRSTTSKHRTVSRSFPLTGLSEKVAELTAPTRQAITTIFMSSGPGSSETRKRRTSLSNAQS